MKNCNRALSLASLLLVLVTATTSLVGGTLAQYGSSASGADTATVAKWDIEVDGTDITQEDSIAFDLFSTIKDSDGSTEADVVSSSIAPGTSGSFALNVANKSEVNANGTITLKVEAPEGMHLVFSSSRLVNLPSGYTQLEYIESKGKSWIKTSYIPNDNTHIVTDVQFTSTTYESAVFGTDTYWMIRSGVGVKAYQKVGTNNDERYRTKPLDEEMIVQRMTLEVEQAVVRINGVKFGEFQTGLPTPSYSLALFGVRNGEDSCQRMGPVRLFSMQIYDNGTLKYDFVPVKNSSNVAGLYDLVEGKFYGSSSSTAFTAGPIQKTEVVNGGTHTVLSADTLDTSRSSLDLAIGETETTTVYWMWAYDQTTTGKPAAQTDNSDTAVGIDAVSGNVSAVVTATAKFEQVD